MFGFLRQYIEHRKPKLSRAQILGARPVRNPVVEWAREQRDPDRPATALLRVPRRKDRWGNFVARMMKLPDHRRLELDEIGSDVWEMCDGTMNVEALTKAVCAKYHLNRRQGETSVTAYLRMLAERRLVALKSGSASSGTGKKSAAPEKGAPQSSRSARKNRGVSTSAASSSSTSGAAARREKQA